MNERLRRLGTAFVDGLVSEDDYRRQKRYLEMEREMLVTPEADAAQEAGKLVMDFPKLWVGANLEERRKLLLTVLDAVYVDTKTRSVVQVKPKPTFRAVLEVANVPLLTSDSWLTVNSKRMLRTSR